jgi:ABC-type Zn uptake system ZnuABC Zn-binding protein ZnuA
MNKDLAQMIITSSSRAGCELADLVPLLKEHGDGDKDESTKLAIGSAIYEIGLIAERVFEQHPDLKETYEARLEKYGRS